MISFEATFAADRANLDRATNADELARIHDHFAALDPERYPGLRVLGRHIWSPVLDERFAYGLGLLLDGLAGRPATGEAGGGPPHR